MHRQLLTCAGLLALTYAEPLPGEYVASWQPFSLGFQELPPEDDDQVSHLSISYALLHQLRLHVYSALEICNTLISCINLLPIYYSLSFSHGLTRFQCNCMHHLSLVAPITVKPPTPFQPFPSVPERPLRKLALPKPKATLQRSIARQWLDQPGFQALLQSCRPTRMVR